MKKFEDLRTYQKAYELTLDIYAITKDFPSEEKFGVISQMRRCSISVAANIAEGNAKNSDKDFLRFLHISLGSLEELKVYLNLSRDLNYLSEHKYMELELKVEELIKMLLAFVKSIKTGGRGLNSYPLQAAGHQHGDGKPGGKLVAGSGGLS